MRQFIIVGDTGQQFIDKVNGNCEELQNGLGTITARNTSFVPSTNILSTNVQDMVQELYNFATNAKTIVNNFIKFRTIFDTWEDILADLPSISESLVTELRNKGVDVDDTDAPINNVRKIANIQPYPSTPLTGLANQNFVKGAKVYATNSVIKALTNVKTNMLESGFQGFGYTRAAATIGSTITVDIIFR